MCWPHIQIQRPGEGEDLFFSRPSKDFNHRIRNIIYDYCFDLNYQNEPLHYSTHEEQRLYPKDERKCTVGIWYPPPHGFVIFCLNRFMYFDASRHFYHTHFRHLTFRPSSFKELHTIMMRFPLAWRSCPNVDLVLDDHGHNNLEDIAYDTGLWDPDAPWVRQWRRIDGSEFRIIYGRNFYITVHRHRGSVISICAHGKLGNLAWKYGSKATIDWSRTRLANTFEFQRCIPEVGLRSRDEDVPKYQGTRERPKPGCPSSKTTGKTLNPGQDNMSVGRSMTEQPTTPVVTGAAPGAPSTQCGSPTKNKVEFTRSMFCDKLKLMCYKESRDCSSSKRRQSTHALPGSSEFEGSINDKCLEEQKMSSTDDKHLRKQSQLALLKEDSPPLMQASKSSNQMQPLPKSVSTKTYCQVVQKGSQTSSRAGIPENGYQSRGNLCGGSLFAFREPKHGINTNSVSEIQGADDFLLQPIEVRRKRKRVDSVTNSTGVTENASTLECPDDATRWMVFQSCPPRSQPLIKVLEEQVFADSAGTSERDAQSQHGQVVVHEEGCGLHTAPEDARRSARKAAHALLIKELDQDTQTNDASLVQSASTLKETSLSSSDTLVAPASKTQFENNADMQHTAKRIRHTCERGSSEDRIQLWLNRPDKSDYQTAPTTSMQCDGGTLCGPTTTCSTSPTETLVQEPQQIELLPSSSASSHTAQQSKSRDPSRSMVLTDSSTRSGSQSWITSCASTASTTQKNPLQPLPAATVGTATTAPPPSPTTTALTVTTTTANNISSSTNTNPSDHPSTATFPAAAATPQEQTSTTTPIPTPAPALTLTPTRAWWETSSSTGGGGGAESRGSKSTGGAKKRRGRGVRGAAAGWGSSSSSGGATGGSPRVGGSGSGRGVGKSSTRLEMATWISLDGAGKEE